MNRPKPEWEEWPRAMGPTTSVGNSIRGWVNPERIVLGGGLGIALDWFTLALPGIGGSLLTLSAGLHLKGKVYPWRWFVFARQEDLEGPGLEARWRRWSLRQAVWVNGAMVAFLLVVGAVSGEGFWTLFPFFPIFLSALGVIRAVSVARTQYASVNRRAVWLFLAGVVALTLEGALRGKLEPWRGGISLVSIAVMAYLFEGVAILRLRRQTAVV